MGQPAKQSRDDFKDVQGLEDLSLKNFQNKFLRVFYLYFKAHRIHYQGVPFFRPSLGVTIYLI